MESATPPRGLEAALARTPERREKHVSPIDTTGKNPTAGSFHVTLYRTDHKRGERVDVPFKIADAHDNERRAELRAEAHAALDKLLDRALPA